MMLFKSIFSPTRAVVIFDRKNGIIFNLKMGAIVLEIMLFDFSKKKKNTVPQV